jgi:uncharacterized membrane protein YsdA (DUF1294 family)
MSGTDKITWIFVAIMLAFTAVILFLLYQADKDCEATGGMRVRTTFSYECLILEKKP